MEEFPDELEHADPTNLRTLEVVERLLLSSRIPCGNDVGADSCSQNSDLILISNLHSFGNCEVDQVDPLSVLMYWHGLHCLDGNQMFHYLKEDLMLWMSWA